MKKYIDMWAARDEDGRYIIAYTMPGIGHVLIKPFTFTTMDAALRYINNVFNKSED
jgi:hypothetical protein